MNDGSVRQEGGPTTMDSKSSQASHKAGPPGEVNYVPAQVVTNSGIPILGNPLIVTTDNAVTAQSIENLQANFTVKEGILRLVANESNPKNVEDTNNVTWSAMVQKSVSNPVRPRPTTSFSYNEDGSVNLIPSKEFLLDARKQWDSSCIGHFIGGILDFKFVREKALQMWKSKGLSRVYYNSKGYFTFRFEKVEEMKAILGLNSVQLGGRTLYLKPWMEGSAFKRNVIDKVPCWIKLGEVPPSYWSRDGLTMIAQFIGRPLKLKT